ncbi:unnamed protein product [Musa acuminata var. zebrina]
MMAAAAPKKRGRPRKKQEGGRLLQSPPSSPRLASAPRRTLRQRRRRPLLDGFADFDDYLDEDEEEEVEEQEGRGKRRKLKVILRLPPPGPIAAIGEEEEEEKPRRPAPVGRASSSSSSASSSSYVDDDDDDAEGDEKVEEEPIKPLKKRRFEGCDDGFRSGGSGHRETEKKNHFQRLKGSVSGVSAGSHAVETPLPEKKLLEAVLHKIQKKDIYGVFAEPVDPEELPDYYDVIEHPMDFGTVKTKLATNAYRSFEQLEDDVFLICTNAMQYNAPDTIYFRQARTMQDIGRKEFQKLRTEGKCIETVSKCEEKIRPDSTEKKPLQKCLPKVVQESFVSDISSATTHPSGGDPCTGLSTAEASGAEPASASNGLADGSCSLGESKSEKVDDLRVKGSPSKLGMKSLDVDENRRATYNVCDQQPATESGTVYDVLEGKQRQLVPVGLDAEYSYARSLARFAGDLGPIAWRIASQRIESALPSGVKFGSGWVGEYEPLPTTILFLEKDNQLEQCQLDTNTSLQTNMPSRDKGTAAGRNASDNDHSKEVNFGIQSQVGTRSYSSRSSDPMKEGNNLCGITQVKQQSSSVTSETQQRGNAVMLRQQKEQGVASFKYCSNRRLVSQALQRPEINTGVASFKSPGNISLGRKPMQHEPLKQTEAMVPCSTTDGRVNVDQFSHGKVLENYSTNSLNNTMGFVSKSQKGIVGNDRRIFGSHEHGLSDPSRLMGLPIKMFNQSNITNSSVDSSKLLPSTVPPTSTESSITADAATARSWMSVGNSLQSKLSVEPVNVCDNPNGSASTYFIGSSWMTPTLSPGNSDNSRTTSMPQALRQPIQVVGLEPQVHNRGLVIFPQLIATDMPRFQGQAPRQGLIPQTENKHSRNACPPDLNISFQPPGSPVRHTSGILKDSQQPDLALQL